MKKFPLSAVSVAAAGLLGCPIAFSADNGFFIGGALGQARSDVRIGNFNLDDSGAGYKVFAGIRPINRLGAEAEYVNFGKAKAVGASVDHDAFGAFLIGYLPLPALADLYGKVGAAHWSADVRNVLNFGDDSGTDLAWGVGLQLRFASFSTRLEYERFNAAGSDHLSLLSLGAAWTFL